MRRAIVVGSFTTLALVSVPPAGAITFGQLDGELHPQVGALVVELGDPPQLVPFCSGTLISSTVFLTAAHCFQAFDAFGIEEFWVTFSNKVDASATLLTGTSHVATVAVTSVTPAQLPTLGLLNETALREQTFTPVGYGTTRDTQQGGFKSLFDNFDRRYATQSFLALQKAWLLLSMNPATGSGGTCYGDSGGPHFLGGTSSNLIVSLTVTGDAVCKATDKTYRLDTAGARAFLDDFVSVP
jgi:secreted trypsin-like serine protease